MKKLIYKYTKRVIGHIHKLMITTKEEVYGLNYNRGHYRPERYLRSHLFSKEILLDLFCSEDLVFCYEDYWNDDICMDMIKKYQPHIEPDEFLKLWLELDEIREIELFCTLIINIANRENISSYQYNLIEEYVDKYKKSGYVLKEIIKDFSELINSNRFASKFNLPEQFSGLVSNSKSLEELATHAKSILQFIPDPYSSALPL